jgi:hypothetical protein
MGSMDPHSIVQIQEGGQNDHKKRTYLKFYVGGVSPGGKPKNKF